MMRSQTAEPEVSSSAAEGAETVRYTEPPHARADALAEAYARCREVARERARNFYYGLRLTPEPKRSAIYSIYAWMRAADDAVDEAGTLAQRRERLEDFSDWTWSVLSRIGPPAGGLGREWLALAVAETVERYAIDREIFDDMLAGLHVDLECPELQTEEDLARYCYGVAGTAGLACVTIWGLRPGASVAEARELALRRGQAFQRTNILRDFAEDFDGGGGEAGVEAGADRRVYIPREALDRHGLCAAELRAWSAPAACEALVREQAALARDHYQASAKLESMIEPACAPTLWAMTRIYSGLLAQVEADPRRVVGRGGRGGERARLAPAAKATIAIRAAIGARMHRW